MKKEQRITHTHKSRWTYDWETTERLLKRQQRSQNVASEKSIPELRKTMKIKGSHQLIQS